MRALLYLAEIAAAVLVLWALVWAALRTLAGRRERRALTNARWARRVVPLEDGRVRIEVAKHGVEKAIPVQTLDPQREDFEVACYEAEARADDLATTMNASDRS